MTIASPRPDDQQSTNPRQTTVFFSDMVEFSSLVEKHGDRVAGELVQHVLEIQRATIEKDGCGTVQRIVGDEVFAILDSPSTAMNRALDIQRQLAEWNAEDAERPVLQIRMGLHIGEIYLEEEGRLEIISRHINRAHRIMEAAGPNQILTSNVVVEMGRDYVDQIPAESLAIRRYGEFYLKGVGPTEICEIADLRVCKPAPPAALAKDTEHSLLKRLEEFGYVDPQ
jgi:class 3 adenylate cyclase